MNLLHLTDLHMSPRNEATFAPRWERMLTALSSLPADRRPQAAALTGDFCYDGKEEEFLLAARYLTALMERLELSPERVIPCPGNHDAVYGGASPDFTNYDAFCQRLGLLPGHRAQHCGLWEVDGVTFAYLNTCRHVTPQHCDAGTLTPEAPRLAEHRPRVWLLHHPPPCMEDRVALAALPAPGAWLLCGHAHPAQPVCTGVGDGQSLCGAAFVPNTPQDVFGCQIVRLAGEGPAVSALLCDPVRSPDFIYKEMM